ncbi:MAG: hypothetical protein AAB963_01095 [Patescibacteria group bacterium]
MLTLLRKNNDGQPILTEYKQYAGLRLLSFFIIGFAIIGIGVGLYAIYNNIYTIITRAEVSLIADPTLSQEAVDFEKYDKVKKAWDERLNAKTVEIKKDPFSAATSTAIK